MSSTRALAVLLTGSLLVSACATHDRSYYPSQAATPMNHPAPPKRRPTPPAAFLAGLTDGKSLIYNGSSQAGQMEQVSLTRSSSVDVQPLAAPAPKATQAEPAAKKVEPAAAPKPVETTPTKAERTQAASAVLGLNQYRVQKGDSLYGISRKFAVPLGGLAEANGLSSPYSLKVSQVLVIPGKESQNRTHRVAKGETVYGISKNYGVEISALASANALSAPYNISPGQTLTIPASAAAAATTQVAASSAALSSATSAKKKQVAPQASRETPVAPETAPAARPANAKIPPPPPLSGGKFLWPIEGKVVGTFGASSDGRRNDGINIIAPRGAPIRAVENGVVAYAGEELRGFGRLLLVKHADGWVTAYAHNDALLVQRGDIVQRGQPIAKVGSSGNVASPQLHFEIRKGSRAVDPRQLLQPSKVASVN